MQFNHHILLRLLEYHGHDIEVNSLKVQLLSDPEQNLQAYSNTCEYFNVKHAALTVPKEALEKLPEYFIAQLSNGTQESVMLIKKNKTGSLSYTKDTADFKTLDKDVFLKEWTGVVFAVESNKTTEKSKSYFKIASKIAAICAAISLIAYLGLTTQSFLSIAISTTLITGCYISYLLIQSKYKSGFSTKICNISKTSDCNAVINSKQALLFGKLELTDVCMVFFSTLLLTYTITSSTTLISIITISGSLILPYSIYVQAVTLKKWCPLCLGVAATIIVLATITTPFLEVSQFKMLTIPALLFSYTLSYFITQFLKDDLKNESVLFENKLQYKTLWRFPQVIDTLLNNLPSVNTSNLHINNEVKRLSQNKIEITVVTNPTCPGCKILHDSLSKALASLKEQVSVQYVFLVDPSQQNKKAYQITRAILSLDAKEKQQAINDWYNNTDETDWKKKYVTKELDIKKGHESLVNHVLWCQSQQISYSPALIINNKQIPNNYTTNQLKDIIEAIKTQQATAVNNSFLQDDGQVKAVLS